MRRPICAVLLLIFCSAAGFAAEQSDILPFKHYDKTLPNGLKVIVVPTGFPNLVSIQIPMQTGSRNEVEPGKSGFAHFFEHMMFRGTPKVSPDMYTAAMTQAGARWNAFTTDDYTNYHATFARDDLETVIALEADRFQHLAYSESVFKTESRAVLGEYNKNSATPFRQLLEVQRDHAYTTHTYKHTTMGFLKDIEDMPNQYAYSKTFFDRWYRPEYATVIIAGDVTPEQVFPLVEKYFSSWARGSYKVDIPQEPPAKGPVYAHVPWQQPGLSWVTVAFHSPAFSDTGKEWVAMDTLLNLVFGPTSDLYKRLVVDQQKVEQLFPYLPDSADPGLATVVARVKQPGDAVYVRNEIMKAFAATTASLVDAKRLADAKSNARYGFARSLDNTEQIAAVLASYVRYERSFDTLNNLFRVQMQVTPVDLQAVARRYFTDNSLVVTTLAKDPLPADIGKLPALASFLPVAATTDEVKTTVLRSPLPQVEFKLLFTAGSAHDPVGKEGLAALSAEMIADAGSQALKYDEIKKALFPMAGGFSTQTDKEMTTFTGVIHKDNAGAFLDIALPQLLQPGFRDEDFQRLKDGQLTALKDDLKSANDEELGKERLQTDIYTGTPYGHPALGTVAGIESITLADVKAFVQANYTRARLTLGLSGDVPAEIEARLRQSLAALPAGAAAPPTAVTGAMPAGRSVDIITKDTRATAVSFGFPIAVTRSSADFAALSIVRAWLGEHRSQQSHLYDRIREVRGMNYGDYAYIEAFPRGMFQFFPDANIARRAQIFEAWLRPLRGNEDAHMALRIAISEIDKLLKNGLPRAGFESTRNYLMKNVYLLTATQDQQLGYALDSQWYGTPEYTQYLREQLKKLTLADVNRVMRRHLQTQNLQIVMITRDAEDLKRRLVNDTFSALKYDGEKPATLLAEDKVIGALKLGIKADAVKITPVAEVFAR
jgi:zinc protease